MLDVVQHIHPKFDLFVCLRNWVWLGFCLSLGFVLKDIFGGEMCYFAWLSLVFAKKGYTKDEYLVENAWPSVHDLVILIQFIFFCILSLFSSTSRRCVCSTMMDSRSSKIRKWVSWLSYVTWYRFIKQVQHKIAGRKDISGGHNLDLWHVYYQ